MELRHLTTFRAVAKSLSFTRAAAELGYVQSALTAHVKALEAELGVRLFDRLGRRIVLTNAGVSLLGYAENILELSSSWTDTEARTPTAVPACTQRLTASPLVNSPAIVGWTPAWRSARSNTRR